MASFTPEEIELFKTRGNEVKTVFVFSDIINIIENPCLMIIVSIINKRHVNAELQNIYVHILDEMMFISHDDTIRINSTHRFSLIIIIILIKFRDILDSSPVFSH